jgi:hypothetical protein
MTLLGVILDLTFQLHYSPMIESRQQKLTESTDSYLKDKVFFESHPLFSRNQGTGTDFADYLRSRVSSDKKHILVNHDLQKTTLSLGKKWLEKRHLIKPSSMIEEIFNRVQTFSRWSVRKTLTLNPQMDPAEFIVASQVYIANSYYTNPNLLVDTLAKVRHMASLLLSSENLNFKLAGLSLLEKEKELLDFMVYKKMPLNGSWEIIPKSQLNRYRKFLYKTYDYLSFLTNPRTLSQLFIKNSLPPGFCSIYHERWPFNQWIRSFLEPQFPFEPSFTDHFQVFAKIKKKAIKNCHSVKELLTTNTSIGMKARIPYYRRIFALKILLDSTTLGEGS